MSTKLFTLTTLLALTSALPLIPRDTILERRAAQAEHWQTKTETQFYRCANGYVGYFSSDPCALPPLASTTTTTVPTPTAQTPRVYEITQPRSYNVYIQQSPDEVLDKVEHVDLQKPKGSRTTTTNAMVFENVPTGAKNCRLNWRNTIPNMDNIFSVVGAGQAWHRQLLGFPDGKTLPFHLNPYRDPSATWSPSLDFTGWPGSPGDHLGPALKCGSQVAIELKGSDEGEQENRVFITLTETNGFYLSYEL
jgi:hypothetical protein